jgi:hypothetical protein
VVDFCENGDETSVFQNGGDFLDHLRDCKLSKGSAAYS